MRRSAIHKLMVAWALLIGLCLGPAVLGSVSTQFLVSDGLDRFVREERTAAQHALQLAQFGCGTEPGDRLLRRKFRVVSVELRPGHCRVGGVPAYRAVVRSYTFFAIPTGTVSVDCGAANCFGGPP